MALIRSRQPFRTQVGLAIALMVAALLSVAAVGVWGVVRIHEESGVALRGYRQLREVFEIGVHASLARQAAQNPTPDVTLARRETSLALSQFKLFAGNGWLEESRVSEAGLRDDLNAASQATDLPAYQQAINQAIGRLATLASQVRATIEAHQQVALQERWLSLVFILSLSSLFALLSIVVGVLHYRSVVHPVEAMASAVRSFAGGKLNARVAPGASREWIQLASDFNHMAGELQALYQQLEEKVDQKSRQLIRSERLASVGYLAAGVAHEINNPLGIIAAYAERALQQLRRNTAESPIDDSIEKAFNIISEEAFRCKEITDRLLDMTRIDSGNRTPVAIAALAREVVSMLADLPQFRTAHLSLVCDDSALLLQVTVNPSEIKQVLLNLLVNACEAIRSESGRVDVKVQCHGAQEVEVIVSDNGQGMSDQTTERVFEPFFSHGKSHRAGTGLGLSICHAIVESHGGSLSAASAGLGKGSEFALRLPIAVEVARAQ